MRVGDISSFPVSVDADRLVMKTRVMVFTFQISHCHCVVGSAENSTEKKSHRLAAK